MEQTIERFRFWLLTHLTDSRLSYLLGTNVNNLPEHWATQANKMLQERRAYDLAPLDIDSALHLKLQFYKECMQQFESSSRL